MALAADLPECVYEAFPELNQTAVSQSYYGSGKPKGLVCDLCVTLLTDIEEILLDQDIEDAVRILYCSLLDSQNCVFSRLLMQWKIYVCPSFGPLNLATS